MNKTRIITFLDEADRCREEDGTRRLPCLSAAPRQYGD